MSSETTSCSVFDQADFHQPAGSIFDQASSSLLTNGHVRRLHLLGLRAVHHGRLAHLGGVSDWHAQGLHLPRLAQGKLLRVVVYTRQEPKHVAEPLPEPVAEEKREELV